MRFPLLAAVLLAATFSLNAQAQYDPGATLDLGTGMGATALGQSTLSGTRHLGQKSRHPDELSPTMRKYCQQWPNEGVCKADQARQANRKQPSARVERPGERDMNAIMRAIAPEYNRRVRLYGRASADRWLAKTAREMGQRDGAAARKAMK
ncbi:hypothetical protein ACVCNR_22060 (plasmid) [Aquamicrobium terrae]